MESIDIMANFFKAIPIILTHEGGYVNDPKDPGGETKYGISKRAFPSIDIKNLTIAQAETIYRTNYWENIRGDEIADQDLATNIFDFAANAGISQAVKTIQKLVNVSIDGKMGSQTLGKINSSREDLNRLFTIARFDFYRSLVIKKPVLSKFLLGWKNRCLSFIKEGELV